MRGAAAAAVRGAHPVGGGECHVALAVVHQHVGEAGTTMRAAAAAVAESGRLVRWRVDPTLVRVAAGAAAAVDGVHLRDEVCHFIRPDFICL